MSEMVERVARAIYGQWPDWTVVKVPNTSSVPPFHDQVRKEFPWEETDDGRQRECLEAARAAIEAMREPTEEMVEASFPAMWPDGEVIYADQFDSAHEHMAAGWAAMIDAALSPDKEENKL